MAKVVWSLACFDQVWVLSFAVSSPQLQPSHFVSRPFPLRPLEIATLVLCSLLIPPTDQEESWAWKSEA